jgi:hypothetical protein
MVMNDKNKVPSHFATDGFSNQGLTEGFVRKGGTNTSFQIQVRPANPTPIYTTTSGSFSSHPQASSGSGDNKPKSSS